MSKSLWGERSGKVVNGLNPDLFILRSPPPRTQAPARRSLYDTADTVDKTQSSISAAGRCALTVARVQVRVSVFFYKKNCVLYHLYMR